MGIPFAAGIQFLVDAQQRFVRAGSSVYLRVKDFEEEGDYLEVGVPFVPTGTQAFYSGYTDILIDPPPGVRDLTFRDIGLLAAKLMFGSRVFKISDTWVRNQMSEFGITDGYDVFRKRDGFQAIGFFYGNKIYSIGEITHTTVSATAILWTVVGYSLEVQSDSTSL
jgi:hypothetical protein